MTNNTPEINAMRAEFYKLKCSLDSTLHLQNFLCSTDLANSLLTDTENLYVQATQLHDQVQEKTPINSVCVCTYIYILTHGNTHISIY